MRSIAAGEEIYRCVSTWSNQHELTDMQPFHGMIDVSLALVEITANLCAVDYHRPDTSEKNAGGHDAPLRNLLTLPQCAHFCTRR